MELKNINDELLAKSKIISFLTMCYNSGFYGEFEYQKMSYCIRNMSIRDLANHELIQDLLCKVGVLPEDYNIYDEFVNVLTSVFDIEGKNIVEIGGGVHTSLADKLIMRQKEGTVQVYDPRLRAYGTENPRLILKKEKARYDTPMDDVDLLIGLRPCKGAETLLSLAIKNNIDFMLWLCEGGPHGEEYDYYDSVDEWLNATLSKAEEGIINNNMGQLKKIYVKKFSDKFPIIYNDRNTSK